MFVKSDQGVVNFPTPEIQRKILSHDGKLMGIEFTLQIGAILAVHTHPHEETGYIIKGRVELIVDGKKEILKKGDTYYAGPNVPHGAIALEECIVFDVFTPQREDYLPAPAP